MKEGEAAEERGRRRRRGLPISFLSFFSVSFLLLLFTANFAASPGGKTQETQKSHGPRESEGELQRSLERLFLPAAPPADGEPDRVLQETEQRSLLLREEAPPHARQRHRDLGQRVQSSQSRDAARGRRPRSGRRRRRILQRRSEQRRRGGEVCQTQERRLSAAAAASAVAPRDPDREEVADEGHERR